MVNRSRIGCKAVAHRAAHSGAASPRERAPCRLAPRHQLAMQLLHEIGDQHAPPSPISDAAKRADAESYARAAYRRAASRRTAPPLPASCAAPPATVCSSCMRFVDQHAPPSPIRDTATLADAETYARAAYRRAGAAYVARGLLLRRLLRFRVGHRP